MRIFKWVWSLLLMFIGLFFANKAYRNKRRADSFQEKHLEEAKGDKEESFEKAIVLKEQAQDAMKKSEQAAEKSQRLQKKLEEKDATSMASRVRDFNSRL